MVPPKDNEGLPSVKVTCGKRSSLQVEKGSELAEEVHLSPVFREAREQIQVSRGQETLFQFGKLDLSSLLLPS